MNAIWFVILSAMLTTYAVLDGFDLGVGALLLFACRNEQEKQAARDSIGPVWNGNEVWLIAAGGAMFMAFPRLYSASFSGFYLALMLVLWLLILRGVGFEFRHVYHHPMWTALWDLAFSAASALLAVLFGVAVGNVLRGVPLDRLGEFQGSFALLLNPFSIVAGLLSLTVLCLHGSTFLAMKTEGALHDRVSLMTNWFWYAALSFVMLFVVFSFSVRPDFGDNYLRWPVLFLLPIVVASALAAVPFFIRQKRDSAAFAATCTLIAALLASAAAGLFPRLLPSLAGTSMNDITIYNAASSHHSLETALYLNAAGLIAVIAYTTAVYKVWTGKVRTIGY